MTMEHALVPAAGPSASARAAFLLALSPETLAALTEALIAAQDAMRAHLATIDLGNWTRADDTEQSRLDDAFDAAMKALTDRLLTEHGITAALT
jgi:hypothetical protein